MLIGPNNCGKTTSAGTVVEAQPGLEHRRRAAQRTRFFWHNPMCERATRTFLVVMGVQFKGTVAACASAIRAMSLRIARRSLDMADMELIAHAATLKVELL